MRTRFLVFAMAFGAAHAQQAHFWEFPNLSDRVQIQLRNTLDLPCEGVAVVRLTDIRKVAPTFPGTLVLATDDAAAARAIETETDTARDEFALAINLQPNETKTVFVYYSETLHTTLPVVPRVYAAHSYGYNRATATLESAHIGYRTYGAFLLDVQAHSKGEDGLFNDLFGFASIRHPLGEGRDVVHTGDTLGLGGLFLRSDSVVYRPPFSTPDYTHRPPNADEPIYRVLVSGPLRAIIEEDLPEWKLGSSDSVSVRVEYEIDAGQEVVHCHWWIRPLHGSRSFEAGAGVRDLDPGQVREAPLAFATVGTQQASDGAIALGLAFTKDTARAGELSTPEAGNEIVVFHQRIAPGKSAEGEYAVGAAWAGSGWTDPQAHLLAVLGSQAARPFATVAVHERTPHPEALASEPK